MKSPMRPEAAAVHQLSREPASDYADQDDYDEMSRRGVFDLLETKETHVVRDQLAESIDAAKELQKGGKTVRADGEHVADDAKPTSDTGASVKKAMDVHPEVVAATAAVTVAMANP